MRSRRELSWTASRMFGGWRSPTSKARARPDVCSARPSSLNGVLWTIAIGLHETRKKTHAPETRTPACGELTCRGICVQQKRRTTLAKMARCMTSLSCRRRQNVLQSGADGCPARPSVCQDCGSRFALHARSEHSACPKGRTWPNSGVSCRANDKAKKNMIDSGVGTHQVHDCRDRARTTKRVAFSNTDNPPAIAA